MRKRKKKRKKLQQKQIKQKSIYSHTLSIMFGLLKQFNKRQLSQLLTANFGGKKGAKPAGGDKPAAEGKPAPAEDAPKKGGKPKKN